MLTRRQVIFGQFQGPMHHGGAMRPLFAETCLPRHGVVCRSCGEACEVAAIVFHPSAGGVSRPLLQVAAQRSPGGSRCTGCGECVKVCPVGALRLEPVAPVAPIEFPEELPA